MAALIAFVFTVICFDNLMAIACPSTMQKKIQGIKFFLGDYLKLLGFIASLPAYLFFNEIRNILSTAQE